MQILGFVSRNKAGMVMWNALKLIKKMQLAVYDRYIERVVYVNQTGIAQKFWR